MSENKKKKCNFKCITCEHYSKTKDFCREKEIEECSKKVDTDFSQCELYLVRHNLIMY